VPALVTQSELRTRVRTAARQANVNGFVSEDELNRLITEGAFELYDLLVAAMGADYFSTVYDFNLTADTPVYNLPDDFYRLTAAMIGDGQAAEVGEIFGEYVVGSLPSGTSWIELPRAVAAELPRLYRLDGTSKRNFRYQLAGRQGTSDDEPRARMRLYPVPAAGVQCVVRIHYIPVCTHEEAELGPTYDGINGWEAYVVAHVVAELAMMQQQDPRFWLSKKEGLRDRIAGLANGRDQAQPEQIADRRGACDSFDDEYDPRGEPPWA
jgi:hypothetical protein